MDILPIVGLIPAAGYGSRLQPLPFSKEVFPIGFNRNKESLLHPKAVASYLLEQIKAGGAEQVYFILRSGKWDIPAYFEDGSSFGLSIAYLMMGLPYGAPFSADQAYSFVKDKRVLFGFPDILISEPHAFNKLLIKQAETNADVVLGIFEVDHPEKWDMVALETDGSIIGIIPKPKGINFSHAWAFACWGPEFTQFMHLHLQQLLTSLNSVSERPEVSVGDIIQAAIKCGLKVQSILFNKGICLDIGTPEDLQKAILKYT